MESSQIEEIKLIIRPFTRRAGCRSGSDISSIGKILSNIKFLRRISEENNSNSIFSDVAQVLTIEIFQAGECIVNYGEFGDKFYILLLGELNVLIPVISRSAPSSDQDLSKIISQLSIVQTSEERQKFKQQKRATIKEIRELEGPGIQFSNKGPINLDLDYLKKLGKIEEMQQVGILSPGDSFGELALLKDKPRAATIQAKTVSVLAVLSKESFNSVLSHEAEKELKEKVNFLCKLPIFKNYSRQAVQQLSFYFEELRFIKGQYIYKENSISDYVYLVYEGEVKMFKTKQNSLRKVIVRSANYSSDGKPLLKLDNARELKYGFQMQVVIKGKNEVFGYENCINNDPLRHESCCCLSGQAIIYAIKSDVGYK